MALGQYDVVVGALVQCTATKTYGVVTRMDDALGHVRWDKDGPPARFSVDALPLARVCVDGLRVRLLKTGEDADVLGPAALDAPAWNCFVDGDGVDPVSVREADLRPLAVADPDEGLELDEEFADELRASLEAAKRGEKTIPAEQIGRELGLTW